MRHHCLHFFLHHGALYKTIASLVLITFTWFVVYPTALAAQSLSATPAHTQGHTSSAEAELSTTLHQIEALLATLEAKLAQNQETRQEEQALAALHVRLKTLDTRVRTNFARLAQQLRDKGLPDEIRQRHTQMVATYDTEVSTLLANLRTMEHATEAPARSEACGRALHHLQAKQHKRRQQPFDPNNLPFRVPDGVVRKPRETTKDYHSSFATPKPVMLASTTILPGMLAVSQAAILSLIPTADDLAPTEDAQITDAIKALAAELKHNPVHIYNWVHDNIEFLPTYGSIQGSQMALDNRKGNAFDTASLLIALLRASDIPARYVLGTIQVPIEQVMNWVGGVHVPEAALQVLGQGGIPSTGIAQGGVITAVKLEHVWVEAWVDFKPSRGAVHRHGDTWVPMDASFKQYEYTEGMDIKNSVPFDSEAFLDQLAATGEVDETNDWIKGIDHTFIDNAMLQFQDQINTFVVGQAPEARMSDVLGNKQIIKTQRSVLASSLLYSLVIRGNVLAQLPEQLLHKFRFGLYTSALDRAFDTPVFQFVENLAILADQKITLSYVPASQADADLIASYVQDLPSDVDFLDPNTVDLALPSYLIQLVAELRVDGEVVTSGGPFTMGQELVSTMGLYDPSTGWHEVENVAVAGEYEAVAIDAAGITPRRILALQERLMATKAQLEVQMLSGLSKETLLGDILYLAVLSYFAVADIFDRTDISTADMVVYRRPSVGRYTAVGQPQYVFGIAQTVVYPGLEMDIDRLVSIVAHKNNDLEVQQATVFQKGVAQSALEHMIPERFFTNAMSPTESVSAVKALEMASRQGQKIYRINTDNVASILPQLTVAPDVKLAIQNAVGTGHVTLISQGNVTVGDWQGVGYIHVDPETGSGAYLISGNINGGAMGVTFAMGALVGLMFLGSAALVGTVALATAASLTIIVSVLLLAMASWLVAIYLATLLLSSPALSKDEKQCFTGGAATALSLSPLGGKVFASAIVAIALPFVRNVSQKNPIDCIFGVDLP